MIGRSYVHYLNSSSRISVSFVSLQVWEHVPHTFLSARLFPFKGEGQVLNVQSSLRGFCIFMSAEGLDLLVPDIFSLYCVR